MITCLTFDDISPRFLNNSLFRRLTDVTDALDVRSTFFIVPADLESGTRTAFTSLLKNAARSGHEPAMHGVAHGRNEFGILHPLPLPLPYPPLRHNIERLRRAKETFRTILDVEAVGFRAPHYMYNTNTLAALSELGFLYDSSATVFRPAHLSRFRFRWLGHRPRRYRSVLRIPVTGDYLYRLRTSGFLRALDTALRDFAAAEAAGAVFVVNNHPQFFREDEFHFLRTLVERLRGRTTFLSLKDAALHFLNNPETAGPAPRT